LPYSHFDIANQNPRSFASNLLIICHSCPAILFFYRALLPCMSKLKGPGRFIIECHGRQSLQNIHDAHITVRRRQSCDVTARRRVSDTIADL